MTHHHHQTNIKNRTDDITKERRRNWLLSPMLDMKRKRLISILTRKTLKLLIKVGNTDEKQLRNQTQHVDKYSNNGIYQVKYPDYEKIYLEQTGRNL